jgi:Putative  PD-(D/E)XK family member, (DUF4420)
VSVAGRHLDVRILLDHIATGVQMIYPFPGTPAVDLLIEGSIPRLTLRADLAGPRDAPANVLRHVRVRTVNVSGRSQIEVSIEGADLMLDGHAMLNVIADRIQLDTLDPIRAVAETLAQWRAVLAPRSRLTTEEEVGLVGELLVLEALYAIRIGAAALIAWRGAISEEHDFGLPDLDVEVKTTSTERREHWISSLTQLVPTGSRPLGLLSLQITRGGDSGRALPTIIEALRGTLDAEAFDEKLRLVGWNDEVSDLFPDRWHLRSPPAFFLVDKSFPAITPAVLASGMVDVKAVVDVRYRIDLAHRPCDRVPDPALAGALDNLSVPELAR